MEKAQFMLEIDLMSLFYKAFYVKANLQQPYLISIGVFSILLSFHIYHSHSLKLSRKNVLCGSHQAQFFFFLPISVLTFKFILNQLEVGGDNFIS